MLECIRDPCEQGVHQLYRIQDQKRLVVGAERNRKTRQQSLQEESFDEESVILTIGIHRRVVLLENMTTLV